MHRINTEQNTLYLGSSSLQEFSDFSLKKRTKQFQFSNALQLFTPKHMATSNFFLQVVNALFHDHFFQGKQASQEQT